MIRAEKRSRSYGLSRDRCGEGQAQEQLTKPPGSLGRLEELVLRLAAIQDAERVSAEASSGESGMP